jgi:hypothetical protein
LDILTDRILYECTNTSILMAGTGLESVWNNLHFKNTVTKTTFLIYGKGLNTIDGVFCKLQSYIPHGLNSYHKQYFTTTDVSKTSAECLIFLMVILL